MFLNTIAQTCTHTQHHTAPTTPSPPPATPTSCSKPPFATGVAAGDSSDAVAAAAADVDDEQQHAAGADANANGNASTDVDAGHTYPSSETHMPVAVVVGGPQDPPLTFAMPLRALPSQHPCRHPPLHHPP